ncbi:MFS transporter [Roseivivax isoporae]|uniref:Sugar:cation symporter n=1 Tax=Roseivivax isoporae LMG 25204 TaxID=1449351 RepID=X7F2T6_9RHOB|nr:MFS transporter [Roseivivax isoporae]ETX27095.1 sugar:cation symporter [Roseivivax isoporae LMG 25204]
MSAIADSPRAGTGRVGGLPGYAVFAGVLSAAGLPIYIHAPKFYADTYSVSLAAMGTLLAVLRLLDVVQDPLLGRLAEALRHRRAASVAVGGTVMAAGMVGLFAVTPPVAPILWFGVTLTLVFSAFSFLTITFYARGVAKARGLGTHGHLRLARWRETGALLGVCIAAVLPNALGAAGLPPFAGFAVAFALAAAVAIWFMRGEWGADGTPDSAGFGPVLRDPVARRLLLVALANAAPVAVSSTLFLFFVESVLQAAGWEGPLLLLFFLAAAASAPAWGAIAERTGAKRALLAAMVLAILSFGFALTLGAGDIWAFALICVASGAAVGADLTLLPAMFARRMADVAPNASEGFSLWSFAQKVSLAFAAAALLPLLEAAGFSSGRDNSEGALRVLSLLYALVPCLLKLVAIAILSTTPIKES